MSSSSFIERFKNRLSTFSKLGNLETATSVPVKQYISTTPEPSRGSYALPSAAMNDSQKPPLTTNTMASFLIHTKQKRTDYTAQWRRHSPIGFPAMQTAHGDAKFSPLRHASCGRPVKRALGYRPYTLQEYRAINTESLKLGGLGPSTIGTEEWEQKRRRLERRLDYSIKLQTESRLSKKSELRRRMLSLERRPSHVHQGSKPSQDFCKTEWYDR